MKETLLNGWLGFRPENVSLVRLRQRTCAVLLGVPARLVRVYPAACQHGTGRVRRTVYSSVLVLPGRDHICGDDQNPCF